MKTRAFPQSWITSLAILLSLVLGTGASADNSQKRAERKAGEIAMIRGAVARNEIKPLPAIMAIARARVPGDVVRTELETRKGRLIYEVRILTANGELREVQLDARTGAIIDVEID